MVQSIINFTEHSNRVLNIVKAKYGFKDKSEAANKIIQDFENEFLEPELRPEYIEKLKKIEKEPRKDYSSLDDFEKRIKNA